jgi:hypothetical protein
MIALQWKKVWRLPSTGYDSPTAIHFETYLQAGGSGIIIVHIALLTVQSIGLSPVSLYTAKLF